MPIHLGNLGGVDENGNPNPITNFRIENAQIIKAYYQGNFGTPFLVYDTETTGTQLAAGSPGLPFAIEAFNHLINDTNCIMAVLFNSSNSIPEPLNAQPLQPQQGSIVRTNRRMGFPIFIDRIRISTDQISFNRNTASGGSLRDDWVNSYSNTSIFLTNFGIAAPPPGVTRADIRTLEARQQDIPDQGIGRSFVRWDSSNVYIGGFKSALSQLISFPAFRSAMPNNPCIVYMANNGYNLLG